MVRGHESVLLVEDDAAVRRLIEDSLEQNGYRVVSAANGDEALAILDRSDNPPDLVVSDIVMTGISGLELARQLRERFPDLPILLVSGYADERVDSAVAGTELLSKPFTSEDLARKVGTLLGPRRHERAA